MMSTTPVALVGAGLAGCETAWQLLKRGIPVVLFEMRPQRMTPAHQTAGFAELVCSNSLKSTLLSNAHGLLKAELSLAGSLIIDIARRQALPAGQALAVDRTLFSQTVESELRRIDGLTVINREVSGIESLRDAFSTIVIATGPLSSDAMAHSLARCLGDSGLYFYDAIAPVVYTESIDRQKAFRASRYGHGEADYLNCPLQRDEYERFVAALIQADKVPFRAYEQSRHFEGCLPLEVMAERGIDTLSYGPMKPVGLIDPRHDTRPWAVLQLRRENAAGTLYNLVGCQTRMKWPEQERVFRMVPGLEQCEFARLGSMHRNTYLNAPRHLNSDLSLKSVPGVYLAGQLTGVEGYLEAAVTGLWVAMQIWAVRNRRAVPAIDQRTMIGGLIHYLMTASEDNFQPMNSNFGLLAVGCGRKHRNRTLQRQALAERALVQWQRWLTALGWL
jgi:methylenetetrahydrofolate--tRNA-(uracil-5-)-methyltransferase